MNTVQPGQQKIGGFPWPAFLSSSGLIVGVFSTGFVALSCLQFFFVQDHLGPSMIFWFMSLGWLAVITFLLGFPCAVFGIRKGWRRIGWLGVVFSMAPAPLGFAMLKIAMLANGVHFD
jgi:hypothetical protein